MSFIGWHGDPCQGHGCKHLRVKHRAEIDGLCRSCWLGSSELQRYSAELDSLRTPSPEQVARAKIEAERDAAFEAWGRL